jgi:hypothetical protein
LHRALGSKRNEDERGHHNARARPEPTRRTDEPRRAERGNERRCRHGHRIALTGRRELGQRAYRDNARDPQREQLRDRLAPTSRDVDEPHDERRGGERRQQRRRRREAPPHVDRDEGERRVADPGQHGSDEPTATPPPSRRAALDLPGHRREPVRRMLERERQLRPCRDGGHERHRGQVAPSLGCARLPSSMKRSAIQASTMIGNARALA